MLKVAINGFGRIGRSIFRINNQKKLFDIVAINDINPDNKNLAYQLKYDSTYGVLNNEISANDSGLLIDNKHIVIHHESKIDSVQWGDVDIVIDASGIHENVIRGRKLINQGIKKCIVTHSPPEKDVDKTIIMGVNESSIGRKDFLLSSSICDANAFAPTINVLKKEYGIDHGFLTTLHPWLAYQNILDGPSKSFAYPGKIHHHYVLGRASLPSLIPKPTSCISASCKVIPDLKDKFLSLSYRVPTSIVSSADMSIKLNKKTSSEEIIELFHGEEKKQKYKIFHNNIEPLVSSDFKASEYSVILDHRWTMLNDSNYLKMILWYDNEWGYSCRVVDLVNYLENIN